ncbi:MAG: right-handed parallel beta-helix repeat-containing protein [Actinomycetota bacterium]
MISGDRRTRTAAVLATAVLAAVLAAATSVGPAGAALCSTPSATTHVDAATGSDSNPGTAAQPYRTIQRAVDRTGSGGTILVRGGDYRESVEIQDKTIHLLAHPDETVYLTGSEAITSWSALEGGRWRSSGTPAAGLDGNFQGVLIDSDHPLAGHLAQVYVDGRELEQVGSAGAVDGDRFHVDGSGRVTIGTNPAGHYVEVSKRNIGVAFYNADHSSLSGFVVRRYATNNSDQGAIVIDGASNGVALRDLRVSDNSNVGAQILGDDVVVEYSMFEKNGRMGINADQADRLVIRHSEFVENNDQRFATNAASGGVKVTAGYVTEVSDNRFERNYSHGLWIDVSSLRADVLANRFVDNTRIGIHIEVSADVLIASNTVVGNYRGIQIAEANDVQIWNNVVLDSDEQAITVLDGYRDAATGAINPDFDPPYRDGAHNHPAEITWNIEDVRIHNTVMARGDRTDVSMLLVKDPSGGVSADDLDIITTYNLYHRSTTAVPKWVVGWDDEAFTTVGGWQARPGSNGTGSLQTTGGLTAVRNDDGDLRVKPGGPGDGAGTPLPGWIVSRLGTGSDDIGLARLPSADLGPRTCENGAGGGGGSGSGGSGGSSGSGGSGGSGGGGATGGPSAPLGSAVFVDVPAGSYYDLPVGWLAETGATTGTSPTTFDPDGVASRAQLATLLWRLAGSPAAAAGSATFTDVAAGSYYDVAVGWLVATGATTGTSPTTFSPDDVATRAQLATLLWRLEGRPDDHAGSAYFLDVPRGAYYDLAVGWLADTEATTGTGPSTFSPDGIATRAQVATILWRLSWGT